MQKIAAAIDYLVAHYQDQPDLENLAGRFGYEPTYFQKIFQDHVGVSPKKFVQYMSLKTAKDFLLNGGATLDAAYRAGLSGNGRLHDLCMSCEAATPGEIKSRGKGMNIQYGFAPTMFGKLMVAQTARGICWLGFQIDEDHTLAESRMRHLWQNADFMQNDDMALDLAAKIMRIWGGEVWDGQKLKLHLFGTNFQIQVWQALLKIPAGATVSYKAIAQAVGNPTASRAVGGAVGANPISLLIPCHRVIQESGIIENYAWGSPRKKILLGAETSNI